MALIGASTGAEKRVELIGDFVAVRRSFPNDDGSATIIGNLQVDGVYQTIRGRLEQEDDLTPGLRYRLAGRWDDHPRWGQQFQFTSYTVDAPHGRTGTVKYLEKFADNVGHKTATRLWEAYEGRAVEILTDEPQRVAEAGLMSAEAAQEASKSLREVAGMAATTIDLMELFAGKGFPGTAINACQKRWGVKAPMTIRRNPFALMLNRIPGAGFKRCDDLYREMGLSLSRLKRQMLCGWYWMEHEGSGHTWLPVEAVAGAIRDAIGPLLARAKPAIKLGLRSKWLRKWRDAAGQLWVATTAKASNEATLAKRIKDLLKVKPTWAGVPQGTLSDHQYAAVLTGLQRALWLLMGSPGTGKTYTGAEVIRAQLAIHGTSRVKVAAPTGKAATRCTAVMKQYGLLIEACTVHRLLEATPGNGSGGFTFKRTAENPIEASVIVIDEVSMLDTDLAARLFSAIRPGTNVLLIGDRNQLPPVQHGAPLRDMVAAGLPQAELTEIRRNSGAIVEACVRVKAGKSFQAFSMADASMENNLVLVDAKTAEERIEAVQGLMQRLQITPEIDPLLDVQVLTATNRTRKTLNRILQGQLNPAVGNARMRFRRGDKVIALVNGFRSSARGGTEKVFVSNGDIGIVKSTSDRSLVIKFLNPVREVRMPLLPKDHRPQEENGQADEEGDGGDQGGYGSAGDFDLAYACTGHKFQGSECPYVIVVLEPEGWKVASREWHYTAISRGKRLVILVGQLATVEQQIQRVGLKERKTFLVELLQEIKP